MTSRSDCKLKQNSLVVLSDFARMQSSFHPGMIPKFSQVLVANIVVNSNPDVLEFGIGNLVNVTLGVVNRSINTSFTIQPYLLPDWDIFDTKLAREFAIVL